MAIVVERKRLSFWEKLYLPQIVSGLFITLKNIFKPRVTLEYPDQSPVLPVGYRGAPTLVKDSQGREKCVSCQLCEFVCPSKAIRVFPGSIPEDSEYAYIEKAPQDFQINSSAAYSAGFVRKSAPKRRLYCKTNFP